MARAVGIGPGTTNSVVSVIEGGEPGGHRERRGRPHTPSIVAFAKNGEVLVGEWRSARRVTNVERTIRSVKRHMGTDWSQKIDDKDFTPQQISAPSCRAAARRGGLPRRAGHRRGDHGSGVLLGPSGRQPRRPATSRASTSCSIVNEPTAAPWRTAWHKGEKEQTILVFDLGGGTFDVSLLEIGDGVSRSRRPPVTKARWDDWDSGSSSTWSSSSRSPTTASPCPATRWPCSACARRREGQDRAERQPSTASTCHTSRPAPTGAAPRRHPDPV